MVDLLLFKVGVWTGYFLTIAVVILVFGFMIAIESRRKERFLVETKSIQQYEDWKKKNSWKIVKRK